MSAASPGVMSAKSSGVSKPSCFIVSRCRFIPSGARKLSTGERGSPPGVATASGAASAAAAGLASSAMATRSQPKKTERAADYPPTCRLPYGLQTMHRGLKTSGRRGRAPKLAIMPPDPMDRRTRGQNLGRASATSLANKLTVLLLSSPNLQDPSTDTIDNTVESLRKHAPECFSRCTLVHALDGPAPMLPSGRKSAYGEFSRRALAKWPRIRQCQAPSWMHLTRLLNYSMRHCITTPYVLVNQDDLALRRRLPVYQLVGTFESDRNVNWIGLLDRLVAGLADWLPQGCAERSAAIRSAGGFCWFSMLRRYRGNASLPLTELVGFTDKLHMARRAWYLSEVLPRSVTTSRGLTWGSRVELHGLILPARTNLNGRYGIINGPANNVGRHPVQLSQLAGLNSTKRDVKIRPENLRPVKSVGTKSVESFPEYHYAMYARAWALGTLRTMAQPLADEVPWPAHFYQHQGTFVLGDASASHVWYEDLDRRCKRGAAAVCDKKDPHPQGLGLLRGEFTVPDGCEPPCHPSHHDIEEELEIINRPRQTDKRITGKEIKSGA